jgi:heme exporter protein C
MAATMLTAMLLMTFAAWAYTIAVALHRVRSVMIEREALSDWVDALRKEGAAAATQSGARRHQRDGDRA